LRQARRMQVLSFLCFFPHAVTARRLSGLTFLKYPSPGVHTNEQFTGCINRSALRRQPAVFATEMSRQTRSSGSHSTPSNPSKTEIIINVYDLLPPGRLSTALWFIGTALLHTGVAIGGKEYAFGGHDRPGITGVYWTKPKTEPPGGVWRCEILHGFTYATTEEIEDIVREVNFIAPAGDEKKNKKLGEETER
jgi:hypothetical protein